jgi:hypothetical protein
LLSMLSASQAHRVSTFVSFLLAGLLLRVRAR